MNESKSMKQGEFRETLPEMVGNPEPSHKITNRLMEGAETKAEETIMPNSALTEFAWLAGILDGEGTIWLRQNGRGQGRQVGVEIVNTCPVLINKAFRIMKNFNPSIYEKKPSISSLGKKVVYRVFVRGVNALDLLKELLPFLTTKQKFADIIINFFSQREPWRRWTSEEVIIVSQIMRKFQPRSVRYSPILR